VYRQPHGYSPPPATGPYKALKAFTMLLKDFVRIHKRLTSFEHSLEDYKAFKGCSSARRPLTLKKSLGHYKALRDLEGAYTYRGWYFKQRATAAAAAIILDFTILHKYPRAHCICKTLAHYSSNYP